MYLNFSNSPQWTFWIDSSWRRSDLNDPVDTERKLNVHKTFRRHPGRLLNVLCRVNLRPVSTADTLSKWLKSLYWMILGLCFGWKSFKTVNVNLWKSDKPVSKTLGKWKLLVSLSRCGQYMLDFLDFWSKWVVLSNFKDFKTHKILLNNYWSFQP